jgi:hypothetical protein
MRPNLKIREQQVETEDGQLELSAIQEKFTLHSLDFLVDPATGLGFRISANIERNLDEKPPNVKYMTSRRKIRESLKIEYFQLDLTTVHPENKADKNAEIELEIIDIPWLRSVNEKELIHVATKYWNSVFGMLPEKHSVPAMPWDESNGFFIAQQRQSRVYEQGIGGPQPVIGDYLSEMCRVG